MKKKSEFFIFFPLLFLFVSLFSCSQSTPDLYNTRSSVIFSYDSFDSLPQVKLSVFAQTRNDSRYIQKIFLKCLDNDFTWETNDIVLFIDYNKNHYAGYESFVMPSNKKFPVGEYKVTYKNGLDDSQDSIFFIDYNTEFYDLTAEQIKNNFDNNTKKKICIFDKNESVIFYGERSEDLSTPRKIWNKYRDAFSYKEIYTISNGNIMFIMPLEILKPGE